MRSIKMSPEVALLHEVWDSIRTHIATKERLNIAEVLVRVFDDNVDIAEAETQLMEFDSVMKAAIVTHFDIGLEDNDDDDDDDWN
jgi:hypothetical protein